MCETGTVQEELLLVRFLAARWACPTVRGKERNDGGGNVRESVRRMGMEGSGVGESETLRTATRR